jgi:hypothetical protein
MTKMTIITLTKLHSGFRNLPDVWTFNHHLAIDTNGDFQADFVLPPSLALGEDMLGRPAVYDNIGTHYDVSITDTGNPVLIGRPDHQVILQPASNR